MRVTRVDQRRLGCVTRRTRTHHRTKQLVWFVRCAPVRQNVVRDRRARAAAAEAALDDANEAAAAMASGSARSRAGGRGSSHELPDLDALWQVNGIGELKLAVQLGAASSSLSRHARSCFQLGAA